MRAMGALGEPGDLPYKILDRIFCMSDLPVQKQIVRETHSKVLGDSISHTKFWMIGSFGNSAVQNQSRALGDPPYRILDWKFRTRDFPVSECVVWETCM